MLYYTCLLILITLLPYLTGMSGVLYLFAAVLLGGGFLYHAIRLKYADDGRLAMRTFNYSITYLAALFSFLLIDHYLSIFWPE